MLKKELYTLEVKEECKTIGLKVGESYNIYGVIPVSKLNDDGKADIVIYFMIYKDGRFHLVNDYKFKPIGAK